MGFNFSLISGSIVASGSITSLQGFTGSFSGSFEGDGSALSGLVADGTVSGSSQIDHDATTNFVAAEHIDHTTVSITGTGGVTGGGNIDSSRTLTLNTSDAQFTGGVKTKMDSDGVVSGSMLLFRATGSSYNITSDVEVTGSLKVSGTVSASFLQGDGSQITNYNSFIFAPVGGAYTTTNDLQITGSLSITGTTSGSFVGDGSGLTGIVAPGTVSESAQIDHDATTNFVGNEHIDHSLVSITGTTGLTGGGTIEASRAITLDTASETFTGGVKTKMNADGVLSGSMADVGIFQPTGSYYATTNDLQITGSVDISSNLTVQGDIYGERLLVSSSVIYESGSTKFGDTSDDLHEFTGSMSITQELAVSGGVTGSSFTGSFVGDGSGLTGLTPAAISSYTNTGDNRLITSVDATSVQGEANLTFDGSKLELTGSAAVTGSFNLNNYSLPELDGVDGQVIMTDGSGVLVFNDVVKYVNVKNVASATLVKGTPVHVTGSTGNTPEIIAASASLASSMPATFVLNEDLAPTAEGRAILSGYINGVDTSTFSEGDIVYVGPYGGYTNVKPSGSNLIQNLGIVTKVDVSNGSGYIYGAGRAAATPNLLNGEVFFGVEDRSTAKPLSDILSGSSYTYSGSFTGSFTGDGSTLTGLTESQITDLVHYTDSDVKTKLNTEAVLSGSGSPTITTVGTITTGTWNGSAISTAYISNLSGTNTGDEPDASTTVKGIVELATTAETTTGTDTTRAVTPDGLKDGYQGSTNVTTLGTITTGTWQGTAIGDSYISSATAWNAKLDSSGTIATNDYAKFDANGDLIGRSYSEVKSDLSLNNVENTALSTWGGSSNIVTVGTITTGTWQGSAISTTYIENTSGTNTGDEPDASTTVKGIVELADTAEVTTGTDTTRAVTPAGLKDGYQGSTNVTTLGTIGTGTWQGTAIADAYISSATTWDAKLDSSGTIAENDYAKFNASGDLIGRSYSEVKSDLSLDNVENTALSTWPGTSNVTTVGTLGSGAIGGSFSAVGVAYGGTGQTSYTNGQLLIGNTTGNTLTKATLTAGNGIDITNGAGSITITGETASATNPGIVELAITSEVTTGTDTTRAVTPAGLKDGYQGSTNVTTLGTIGTGTWNGSVIASAYLDSDTAHLSGTQTFTGAKTFSGGVTGSSFTGSFVGDGSGLTGIAGTTYTAGNGISLSGTEFTVAGNDGLVANTDGLSIDYVGTDNFIDAATDLEGTAIATGDTIVYHDASDDNVKKGFVSDLPFTNNTGTVTSVGGTGTVNGLSLSGTVTTSGNLTLGGTLAISNADWSGTDLSVSNGGTGVSTLASGQVLIGNGTSAITTKEIGITDNSIVEIDGTGVTSGDYAKFTANGLEGRSVAELRSDINVEDGADVTDTANVKSALDTSLGGAATIGDGSDTITIPGSLVVTGTVTTNYVETISTSNGVIFEGNADDGNELTLLAGTLSADRTITLPNADGTVALTSDIPTLTSQLTNDSGFIDTSGTVATNDFAKFTDADTVVGRNAAEVRTDLGLVIGTNVQAYDADLTTIGGLAKTSGNLIIGNGSLWTTITSTAIGQAVVTGSSAAAIRSTIGAGTGDGSVTSVGGTGTVSGLTLSGTVTTSGNLTLGGTLAVATSNINNNAVTHAKYQQIATDTILGRTDAGTGNVSALTAVEVRGILNVADGANNYSHPNHTGHVTSTGDGATVLTVSAITGQTALTSGLAATDELLLSDGGVIKRMDVSVIEAYMNSNLNFTNNAGTVTSVGGTGTVSGLTLSGTVTTSGNLTLGGTLAVATANINNDAVTYAKIQNVVANNVILGNNGGAGTVVQELSAADVRTIINVADGADNYSSWTLDGGGVAQTISSGETVTFEGSGGTTVTNVGNTVTISSTDNNTTYSAGDGISLSGTEFSVAGGTGLSQGASGLSIDYAGTDNFIDSATNLEGTAIATGDTIVYHDATDNIVKKGFVSDLPFGSGDGTVTNITVGDGLSVTDPTATPNITLNLSGLDDMTADVVGAEDELILLDSTSERRKAISEIKLGQFNNDQGWTSNTGDITGVTAGVGLGGGGTSGGITLYLDFSELTDMTGDIAGTTEFILQDGTTESRKAASEIKLSAFNNDSGFVGMTNNTNNYLVTATGTGLNGESKLTFNGSSLLMDNASTVETLAAFENNNYGIFMGASATKFYFAPKVAGSTNFNREIYFDGTNWTIEGNLDVTSGLDVTGSIAATGDIIAYASDERLKENIERIQEPLPKIKKLKGVMFDWNETADKIGVHYSEKHDVGVIAQDVEKVLPEAVRPAPANSDYKTVRYERLVPLLIEGMKEQQDQIDELKAKIEILENK